MDIIVFLENDKIKSVFQDNNIFRKKTFHYIIGHLEDKKCFSGRKEAGHALKEEFKKFYEEEEAVIQYGEWNWKKLTFKKDEMEDPYEVIKKRTPYLTKYTKINTIRGSNSYKCLNTPISYVKLSPLFQKG